MKYQELTYNIIGYAINYCQAYNLPIGLLINFGARSLEFKRVYNVNHTDNTNKDKGQRKADVWIRISGLRWIGSG